MDEHSGSDTNASEVRSAPPGGVPTGSMLDDPDFRALREFLSLSGGSVLFCLSAFSIFLGLSAVVGPVLGESYALSKTLPAIGTIGLYELSLFGVMLALVLRWRITRDAVSLLVLVAVFLITLGLLVSTVANDNPRSVFAVAAAVVGAGLIELAVIRRRIGVPMSLTAMAGVAILLAWNGLNSTFIAYYIGNDGVEVRSALEIWRVTVWIPVAGALLFFLDAASARTASYAEQHRAAPFLRTPGMMWVFIGTLVAGSAVHQYAMGYIFDLNNYLVDYLPLLGVATLTLIEIARGYGRLNREVVVAAALIPISAVVIAISSEGFDVSAGLGHGLSGHPAVWALIFTAMLVWMGWRHRGLEFAVMIALYGLVAAVLLFPDTRSAGVEHVNWDVVRFGLAIIAVPILLAVNHPALWALALGVAAIAAPALAPLRDLMRYDDLSEASQAAAQGILFGVGIVVLATAFGAKLHRAILWFGALVLAVCVLHFVFLLDELGPQTLISLGALACAGLLFWRTRDAIASGVLTTPLLRLLYDGMHDAGGWRYILIGFALLAVGTVWSVRSHRYGSSAEPVVEDDA